MARERLPITVTHPERVFVMFPVVSSTIRAIGYESSVKKLRVQFKSGDTYEYDSVEPGLAQELVCAESIGAHFHKAIKTQDFSYRKII